jgi:hypothetical protein
MPYERFHQRLAQRGLRDRLENRDTQRARLSAVYASAAARGRVRIPDAAFNPDSWSLAQYQTGFRDQGSRGTCWAFAGCAALEAAYKRQFGLDLDLSEQYAFHIGKSTELYPDYMTNNLPYENNTSLTGFQGSSDIVEKLTDWAVPEERFAPYRTQAELEGIAQALYGRPDVRTQEEYDAVEYSEKHIPLGARQDARYRVANWAGLPANPSPDDVERVLRSGREVVADIEGHCLLVIGYDRNRKVFLAKNSWGETDFIELDYAATASEKILGGYYITDVVPPAAPAQQSAFWLGSWEMDHDGWRGKLVIRRLFNPRDSNRTAPTKLGNYYSDGKRFDVNGTFGDDGRSLLFHIASAEGRIQPGTLQGQEFRAYVFTRDPRNAAGRTLWEGLPFGVSLARESLPPRPASAFSRSDWGGKWRMNHDGWRGLLAIVDVLPGPGEGISTVKGSYTAENGPSVPASGTVRDATPHVLTMDIELSAGAPQRFDLLHHTRESGTFSGVTTWAGQNFGVQGQKQ